MFYNLQIQRILIFSAEVASADDDSAYRSHRQLSLPSSSDIKSLENLASALINLCNESSSGLKLDRQQGPHCVNALFCDWKKHY